MEMLSSLLSRKDVLAIMVTYNPDSSILDNVYSLIEQVDELLIIDNCSDSLNLLKIIENNYKITIIYNNENMGIAYALNQGLNVAKNKKYKLFLTMDQDSFVNENCISKMIKILNENRNIVSVGPNLSRNAIDNNLFYKEFKEVDHLISSGNIVYTQKALEVNGYLDDLFIDAVDLDFSLALKLKGGGLVQANNAYMDHKLGKLLTFSYCGLTFNISTHSPLRYYYMYRNHYYIIKKYISKFTIYCIRNEILMWKYLFIILIFLPNRRINLKMIISGIKDATQSKYGKYLI